MLTALSAGDASFAESLLLDDFSRNHGVAVIGGVWQGFTDRVMGGRSDIRAGFAEREGRRVLRMEGEVSLENNGGFVQLRLPLDSNNLDAGNYAGVRIRYRIGLGEDYYIHLRTRGNRLPWSYFAADLESHRLPENGDGPLVSELPWEAFVGESTALRKLRPGQLKSLAVVAAKSEGPISIDLFSIELFR
jgi:hypothetical protein